MSKLKSHKTVEQIAKKHRLDVSFIQKQLDMGEPIEHEHTKDHELAMDIALQHLDEIPDYYTRLKKMEASAKKEHNKFKDVNEGLLDKLRGRKQVGTTGSGGKVYVSTKNKPSNVSYDGKSQSQISAEKKQKSVDTKRKSQVDKGQYDDPWLKSAPHAERKQHYRQLRGESMEEKRYCPLCDKRESRSECSYGEKAWDKVSVKDEEYSMARSELATMTDAIKRLQMKVGKGEGNLEAWIQSKITKAADYIDTAADYVGSREMDEQKLVNKIIDELNEGKKRGLWDNIHAKRKRGERPARPGEKGYPETLNVEETEIEEGLKQARKNVGASKCWTGKKVGSPPTKMKGGREVPNCVPENVTIEDANGNTFAEVIDLITPEPIKGFKSQIEEATRIQTPTGNIISVILSWKGKTYSSRMFFPQVSIPSRQDIEFEIQKIYPGSKILQHRVSDLNPGQPLIVVDSSAQRSKNYLLNNKTIGEENIEEVAAWQRSEGKNKKGGLNEKGRKSYERENPGSDLKSPSKKVGNPRRASFCARMSGMKKKLTSAKTANDPNSRINKSLRAWNC